MALGTQVEVEQMIKNGDTQLQDNTGAATPKADTPLTTNRIMVTNGSGVIDTTVNLTEAFLDGLLDGSSDPIVGALIADSVKSVDSGLEIYAQAGNDVNIGNQAASVTAAVNLGSTDNDVNVSKAGGKIGAFGTSAVVQQTTSSSYSASSATITDSSGGTPSITIAAATNIDTLTDSTSGSADDTVDDVSTAVTGVDGTGNNAASKTDVDIRLDAINDNFKEVTDQLITQQALNVVLINAVSSLVAELNKNKTDTDASGTAGNALKTSSDNFGFTA